MSQFGKANERTDVKMDTGKNKIKKKKKRQRIKFSSSKGREPLGVKLNGDKLEELVECCGGGKTQVD